MFILGHVSLDGFVFRNILNFHEIIILFFQVQPIASMDSVGVQRDGTEGWKNYSVVLQKVGRMVLWRSKENVQMDGRIIMWLAKVIVPEDGRMFLWRFKENVQKDGSMILSTETQVNNYSMLCLEELEHL